VGENFFPYMHISCGEVHLIELYKANFNLFEGINCENVEGPIFNPVFVTRHMGLTE
jgi:hypothetical protein